VETHLRVGGRTWVFGWPTFYELEVNGVKLVDWVAALIPGEPFDDVHCVDCEVETSAH
jgi:hypothetical protein